MSSALLELCRIIIVIIIIIKKKCIVLEFERGSGEWNQSLFCTSLPGCQQSLWSVRSVKMELDENLCHCVTVRRSTSGCPFDHSMQVGKCLLKYLGLFPSCGLLLFFKKGTSTDTNSHVKKIYTHVPVCRVFFWNTAKSCSPPTLSSSVHHAPIEFLSSVFRISGETVRMVPLKFEFRDWKRVKPCVFHPLAVVTMDANRRASVEGNAPGTRMSSRLLSWSFNRCG